MNETLNELNTIEILIKEKKIKEAINRLFNLVSTQNEQFLLDVLIKLDQIITSKTVLDDNQIEIIKSLIDHYDENVHSYSLKIFIKCIKDNNYRLKQNFEFCIDKLNSLEYDTRFSFIELFVIKYPWDFNEDKKRQLFSILVDKLKDNIWEIKLMVIQFLKKVLDTEPEYLKQFDEKIMILLDEQDVDIIRECLEFLFYYIISLYSDKDVGNLFNYIYEEKWRIQEKVIWLLGKIGIKNKNFVLSNIDKYIKLLEHENFYVRNEGLKILCEIINFYPDIFDENLIKRVLEDSIDNINAIEILFKKSIEFHGFERFLQLFNYLSPIKNSLSSLICNSIRKLYEEDPEFVEFNYENLILHIFKQLNEEDFIKLKYLIESIVNYNIYFKIYNLILYSIKNESNKETKNNKEELFKSKYKNEILELLLNKIPGLGNLNIGKWLEKELAKAPIDINNLCKIFSMSKNQAINVLKEIKSKGILNFIIKNDMIMKVEKEIAVESENEPDLHIEVKWEFLMDEKSNYPKFKLKSNIKNISNVRIDNINIITQYPEDVFKIDFQENKSIHKIDQLNPQELKFMELIFRPNINNKKIGITSIILFLFYFKEEKISDLKKEIQILLF